MKFAKELEENLVAEWKEKYLDYKGGKKKLKAVARAVRNADKPPRSNTIAPASGSFRDGPVQAFLKRSLTHDTSADAQHGLSTTESGNHASNSQTPRGTDLAPPRSSQPQPINERSPLYPRARTASETGDLALGMSCRTSPQRHVVMERSTCTFKLVYRQLSMTQT